MDFFFRISGDLLDKQKDTIHTTFQKKKRDNKHHDYRPIHRHGNTGQNFLTRPDPTRPEKYLTRTRFFLTRSKNGLTRDPTQFYYGSTRPDPDNPWPDPLKKSLIFFLLRHDTLCIKHKISKLIIKYKCTNINACH